jgi:hypothetical protein
MKSNELAVLVGETVKVAQSRITGVGKEQYEENSTQKFEGMSIPDLLVYMEEELLDQINYAVMNYLRVHSMKKAVEKMAATMQSAGLGNADFMEDMRNGKAFKRNTLQDLQSEIRLQIPIEDKKLPLA